MAVLVSQTRRVGFAAAMWGFMRVMLHGLLPLAVESWWCETSALTGCRGHPRHFAKEEAKGVADKFKALPLHGFFGLFMLGDRKPNVRFPVSRVVYVLVKQRCHDLVLKRYEPHNQQDHARLVLKRERVATLPPATLRLSNEHAAFIIVQGRCHTTSPLPSPLHFSQRHSIAISPLHFSQHHNIPISPPHLSQHHSIRISPLHNVALS